MLEASTQAADTSRCQQARLQLSESLEQFIDVRYEQVFTEEFMALHGLAQYDHTQLQAILDAAAEMNAQLNQEFPDTPA